MEKFGCNSRYPDVDLQSLQEIIRLWRKKGEKGQPPKRRLQRSQEIDKKHERSQSTFLVVIAKNKSRWKKRR